MTATNSVNAPLCVTKDNQTLFSSPLLEDFSRVTYKEDNPHASSAQIASARELHERLSVTTTAQAKAVCAQCPLLASCLKSALALGPDAIYGVVGGLTREERIDVAENGLLVAN